MSPSISTPVASSTAPRFESELSEDIVHPSYLAPPARVMWWSSILAGAVAAMALQVIFALLGTAIGLTVLGTADDAPEAGLSIGGAIYWLVTGLISLFVGGFIASRFRNTADGSIGAMHGFMTWCSVTVLSALLVAVASGAAIGGSLSVIGDAMAASTRGGLHQSARTGMIDPAAPNTADRGLDGGRSDADIPQITPQERKEAASDAARASWWTLIALALGAALASAGGRAGVRDAGIRPTRASARSDARS